MATSKTAQLSNNNLVIVMVLISLLVIGVSGLIAKALVSSVVRDTKVISAKSKADKQLKDDLSAAPKLVDAFNAMGSTANTLNDALPNTTDLPSLLVTLENMSNDAGITLKSVAPIQAVTVDASAAPSTDASAASGTGSVVAAAPQKYDFAVDFDGSYPALQKFLGDIETSARPMHVTGLQMDGSGSSLSGEIDVETYWQDKAQLPFGTEVIK